MKKISISDESLAECAEKARKERFVMKGLPEKSLGALIGAPDTGKSRLMHSMAYSLASGVDFLALLPVGAKPRKVALWTSEEGVYEATKFISKMLPALPSSVRKRIQENIVLIDDDNGGDKQYLFKAKGVEDTDAVSSLVEQLQGVDLIFIDTIRESIGVGSEVEDDVQIRVILEKIIRRTGCSIVYLHHLTKTDAKLSADKLSSTSGSGLSATSAKARVHYTLTMNSAGGLQLDFTKANKLPKSERASIHLTELAGDDGVSMPVFCTEVLDGVDADDIFAAEDEANDSIVVCVSGIVDAESGEIEDLHDGAGSCYTKRDVISERAKPSEKVRRSLDEKIESKQVVVVTRSSQPPPKKEQSQTRSKLRRLRKPENKKM
ncbi:AAA family ATPase [Photobacterium damselae]|uniref:AAA family ATPase n=1 Tax=Photobacterium damselae TaxID=38293 RepID=UPI001F357B1B|nr:AAA family ATPase [Photobacterium damselae]UKA04741.1 helicase RepA family protein [Photobacterium damselae subsp. damselae]